MLYPKVHKILGVLFHSASSLLVGIAGSEALRFGQLGRIFHMPLVPVADRLLRRKRSRRSSAELLCGTGDVARSDMCALVIKVNFGQQPLTTPIDEGVTFNPKGPIRRIKGHGILLSIQYMRPMVQHPRYALIHHHDTLGFQQSGKDHATARAW